jgi:hypothetical protein
MNTIQLEMQAAQGSKSKFQQSQERKFNEDRDLQMIKMTIERDDCVQITLQRAYLKSKCNLQKGTVV